MPSSSAQHPQPLPASGRAKSTHVALKHSGYVSDESSIGGAAAALLKCSHCLPVGQTASAGVSERVSMPSRFTDLFVFDPAHGLSASLQEGGRGKNCFILKRFYVCPLTIEDCWANILVRAYVCACVFRVCVCVCLCTGRQ